MLLQREMEERWILAQEEARVPISDEERLQLRLIKEIEAARGSWLRRLKHAFIELHERLERHRRGTS